MNSVPPVVTLLQNAVQEDVPELAPACLCDAPSDGFGNYTVLEAAWPRNPKRCSLAVFYRGDCFEVAFSVVGTRGPAEQQIITTDPRALVEATIEFLRDIVSGHIVVDVVRHRLFWFRPYYLAFFRQASRRAKAGTVETIRWPGAA